MLFQNRASWSESFEDFWANFVECFQRKETRQCAGSYVRGLLTEVERKNCWQVAEEMGQADPQQMQRLLYEAQWDEALMCKKMRALVVNRLGYEPGVGVIDESGFVKRGEKSVGVGRQYCGCVGKVENCQIGVFLGYIAPLGYAFLDRELYLPADWCANEARRAAVKIPAAVEFQTKPQLAQQMLSRAWSEGIPMQWVVADTTYGNSSKLRNFIHEQERYYVMEVPKTLHVQVASQAPQKVSDLEKVIPSESWQCLALEFGEGASKGCQ